MTDNHHRVAAVPGLAYVLWRNAGFASLRTCKAIQGVDPRHDPTVVPVATNEEENALVLPESAEELRVPPLSSKHRFYTIADYHNAYKAGTHTPVDVVESLLPLIRRDLDQRSRHLDSFVDTKVELVRQAATESTIRWKSGQPISILDGVPFAVKDDLDVQGYAGYTGHSHTA